MTTNSTRENLSLALDSYMNGLVNAEFLAAQSFAQSIADQQAAQDLLNTPKYLIFYWDLDDITSPVKMLSSYKGKNITSQDKAPVSRLDDVSISDDEDTVLDRLLKKAASKVYSAIGAYGKGISGGYLYNQGTLPIQHNPATEYNSGDLFYVGTQLYLCLNDETPAGTDPTDTEWFLPVGEEYNTYHKIIYTLLYSSTMDSSMITVLDDNLEDALVKHVLIDWYKVINEAGMIPIAQAEYDDALSEVHSAMWYRKTPTRRRTELL